MTTINLTVVATYRPVGYEPEEVTDETGAEAADGAAEAADSGTAQ